MTGCMQATGSIFMVPIYSIAPALCSAVGCSSKLIGKFYQGLPGYQRTCPCAGAGADSPDRGDAGAAGGRLGQAGRAARAGRARVQRRHRRVRARWAPQRSSGGVRQHGGASGIGLPVVCLVDACAICITALLSNSKPLSLCNCCKLGPELACSSGSLLSCSGGLLISMLDQPLHGCCIKALRLRGLRMQERHGVLPCIRTFSSLIGGCAYARQPALAYKLVRVP